MRILKKAFFRDEFDGYMALRLASSAKNGFLLGIEFVSDTEYEFCPTQKRAMSLFSAWARKIVEHIKGADDDSGDFKPAPFPKPWIGDSRWPPVSEWSTFTESTL